MYHQARDGDGWVECAFSISSKVHVVVLSQFCMEGRMDSHLGFGIEVLKYLV